MDPALRRPRPQLQPQISSSRLILIDLSLFIPQTFYGTSHYRLWCPFYNTRSYHPRWCLASKGPCQQRSLAASPASLFDSTDFLALDWIRSLSPATAPKSSPYESTRLLLPLLPRISSHIHTSGRIASGQSFNHLDPLGQICLLLRGVILPDTFCNH